MRLDDAERLAAEVVDLLAPATERVEVAGSIRRRKAEVGDIEIVAIPRLAPALDLWEPIASDDLLEARVRDLRNIRTLRLRDVGGRVRDGRRYKALDYAGAPLDLFIVRPPATWGVLLFLRTGPEGWNRRVVTECRYRGLRFQDGRIVTRSGLPVASETEEDVFRALGLAWVDPPARSADAVRWE
jgi:DNA polymerase (family 10)